MPGVVVACTFVAGILLSIVEAREMPTSRELARLPPTLDKYRIVPIWFGKSCSRVALLALQYYSGEAKKAKKRESSFFPGTDQ